LFFPFTSARKAQSADTLSIIGVGDIMIGSNFPDTSYLPPNDGAYLLKPVKEILQNADVTFGNLEGTLLDSGGKVKECKDTTICYAFRSPIPLWKILTEAGFDMVSLANNHSGDFGPAGRLVPCMYWIACRLNMQLTCCTCYYICKRQYYIWPSRFCS
jgi:hypothetical protein